MQDKASPPAEAKDLKPGKRIVIFADGTGNAYSMQESNIWRLYNALDKTLKPEGLQQIARYIPGVGTSSNWAVRLLDGATGFGVPSNVRELYRFLCWNCGQNDQIYLFGFSRGAFTVRALAGMLSMQGLMPREIKGLRVGAAEMKRNAAGAWRAYRTETAPLVRKEMKVFNPKHWQMNPLISLVRLARDAVIWSKRKLFKQMQHDELRCWQKVAVEPGQKDSVSEPDVDAQTWDFGPGKVKVRFMGVYDTVEAYGIPEALFAELVNVTIWPFQFRNHRCSPIVETVRHALALDDERRTFHPIRFDQRKRDDGQEGPETRELWFAGMHSDVGGGYPDNAVALDSLVWMADEGAKAGLNFHADPIKRYRDGRYPQALIHDSRAGLASFYRYKPRRCDGPEANGNAPVLHSSAKAKMLRGANGYKPLILPEVFDVLDPEDAVHSETAQPSGMQRCNEANARIMHLMRWRTTTNLLTITCVMGLIVLLVRSLYRSCLVSPDVPAGWCPVLAPFGAVFDFGWSWGHFLKSDLVSILIFAAGIGVVYVVNLSMADKIKDQSRRLWK